nr:hypothetical protein [Gammaproteobacteria bacterium]
MWSKLRKGWDRIHLFVAVIIAILGFVYFISQALDYSETLPPVAPDEGMNLYQGYLFATGRYQPFEDYGPWSFQMPVSYLIPGLVQARYGPGMEVGRLYAVVVGAIAVLGLWLTVQRNSTLWWAAAAVWAIALNPTYVQYFSQARTEALVSMLFSWMLFFGLGAERQDWELAVAGFLAGVAGMAHLNVLLVLPLYILYVFWQFDRRAGLSVLAAGLLPVAFVHIAYWPDVLRVWAGYIRPELFSWADEYRPPARGNILPANFSWWPVTDWIGDRGHLAWVGLRALGQTLRVHFLVFFGVLTTLLLWPWRRKLRPGGRSITKVFFNQHKQVVFLLITFLTLFVVYLRGANGITCQFSCLPGNIMYFFVFGLILVPISYTGWREEMPIWKQVAIIMIIFLL